MGKMLPGEPTGLASMVNSAGRYGIRAHPIPYEEDHVLRFFHIPAVQERFFQFFVGQFAPMRTVCVRKQRSPYLSIVQMCDKPVLKRSMYQKSLAFLRVKKKIDVFKTSSLMRRYRSFLLKRLSF